MWMLSLVSMTCAGNLLSSSSLSSHLTCGLSWTEVMCGLTVRNIRASCAGSERKSDCSDPLSAAGVCLASSPFLGHGYLYGAKG